jgi:hypothetical protein
LKYALIFAVSFLILSCNKKNDDITEDVTPQHNAKLEVTVYDQYIYNSTLQDSLLPNATVTLYNNEDDAFNEVNIQRVATTGTNGLVVFSQLDSTHYILHVTHAIQGSDEQFVETPNNSVTKLDVLL